MSDYSEIINCIHRNASHVSIQPGLTAGDATQYKFQIDGAGKCILDKLKKWAIEHPLNWGLVWLPPNGTSIHMNYIVKSETAIAKALVRIRNKENEPIYGDDRDLEIQSNPCAELFAQEYPATFTTIKVDGEFKQTQENKMHEIKQQYTIGGATFTVPNNDLDRAEKVLITLTKELGAVKAERKEHKKLFEDGLPLVMSDRYDREISILLESIQLLDEITELKDDY